MFERKNMNLAQLRQSRGLTQNELAEKTGIEQANLSKLERRWKNDILLSTLQKFVEGIGGKLQLVAVFPDGSKKIELTGEDTD